MYILEILLPASNGQLCHSQRIIQQWKPSHRIGPQYNPLLAGLQRTQMRVIFSVSDKN